MDLLATAAAHGHLDSRLAQLQARARTVHDLPRPSSHPWRVAGAVVLGVVAAFVIVPTSFTMLVVFALGPGPLLSAGPILTALTGGLIGASVLGAARVVSWFVPPARRSVVLWWTFAGFCVVVGGPVARLQTLGLCVDAYESVMQACCRGL